MGFTPLYGIPFPDPSGAVRDGAAEIQATATKTSQVIATLAGGAGGYGFRAGSSVVHTDQNGAAVIPISPAFTQNIPGAGTIGSIIVAMNGDGATTFIVSQVTTQAWTQQWTVIVKQSNGSPLSNVDVRINWIAVGIVS